MLLFLDDETCEGTHGSMSRRDPRSLQRSVDVGVGTAVREMSACVLGFIAASSSIKRADLAATASKSPSSISLNFRFPDWGIMGVGVNSKLTDAF